MADEQREYTRRLGQARDAPFSAARLPPLLPLLALPEAERVLVRVRGPGLGLGLGQGWG